METNEPISSPTVGADLADQNNPALSGKKEKKIPVVEMFGPTIEGEGSLVGTQTMFIRFGLCDYKCKKCDSMHAVDPALVKVLAEWRTCAEIADDLQTFQERTHSTHIRNVTFSGGNPAIHDLTDLVAILKARGYKVFVETQGTKHPDWLNDVDHVVVSPKSPGMGETFNHEVFMEFVNAILSEYTPLSVKVVVFSNQDLEFAAGVAQLLEDKVDPGSGFMLEDSFYLSLGNPLPPVFAMIPDPEDGKPSVAQDDRDAKALVGELLSRYNALSTEILKDPRLSFAKFLPQLHVLVWGNETGK